LFVETFVVPSGDALMPELCERPLPALRLTFDYLGTKLRVSDARGQFFVGGGVDVTTVDRDREGEARVARLIEGFGAVDLRCLSDIEPALDSEADYVLAPQGGAHAWCSFSASALPELRALGYRVEVEQGYPYGTGDTAPPPWHATIEEDDEREDWFSLELGVEVNGRRVDLLPVLIEWLEGCSDDSSIESVMNVPARFRAIPTSEGYVLVPPERLRTVLQVLVELYRDEPPRKGKEAPQFPGALCGSLAKLDAAFDNADLKWSGATGVLQRGRALVAEAATAPSSPIPGLQATLRSYQERGVAWLQNLRAHQAGGVLADDMGLGKTLQTIAHLATEKMARRTDLPTLIVMPTSLVGNWRREIAKFAPFLRVGVLHGPKRHEHRETAPKRDVVLTTYPVLVRDLEFFASLEFHYVILDEAQAIKNRKSLAHRAVISLTARHRLCLSGTPVENNLEELRSLFAFLMPELLGSSEQFQARFARPIEQGRNVEQLRILRETVSPYLLRRMKEQVAPELPPKTELIRYCELKSEQRELYESIRLAGHAQVRRAIRQKGMAASAVTILDALMKLRQVCCDPRLVAVQSAAIVRGSAKYDMLMELLETQLAEGRRVLLFSQFTTMLALISAGLTERRVAHVALTGQTADRQKPIDAFDRGEADVFLISLKAGGTGLNLTSADTVIHYDPWWNPAAQGQATDRAYRIGQTRPVFVYNLVVTGSVEERMLRLQQRKRFLADSILGHSQGPIADLSPEDLEGLFAPLSGQAEDEDALRTQRRTGGEAIGAASSATTIAG